LGGAGEPTATRVADAIVSAVQQAKASLRPAKVGYGSTRVDLNMNRDLFDGQNWIQGANPSGPSDKTLAVVDFVGDDGIPIGVYMNYAMHPINFYLSGVISSDFAGQTSRYVERQYDDRTVAVFSQGASGDQNPRYYTPFFRSLGQRTNEKGYIDNRVGAVPPWTYSATMPNANTAGTEALKSPVPAERQAAYRRSIAETGEIVTAMGAILGESALDIVRFGAKTEDSPLAVASASEVVTCPGRERVDTSARQGVAQVYKDSAPVVLEVGLLKLGDIAFVRVNGEVYSEIASRVKAASPLSKTIFVTLANGGANSGYIYSNAASNALSFQVIGSRLKPGCAEDKIVDASQRMFARLR
jgi:hypothetical protein